MWASADEDILFYLCSPRTYLSSDIVDSINFHHSIDLKMSFTEAGQVFSGLCIYMNLSKVPLPDFPGQ